MSPELEQGHSEMRSSRKRAPIPAMRGATAIKTGRLHQLVLFVLLPIRLTPMWLGSADSASKRVRLLH